MPPKTVTISVHHDTEDDAYIVADDGGDYEELAFNNDGEQSTAKLKRWVEEEIEDRIHHYKHDHEVRIDRR